MAIVSSSHALDAVRADGRRECIEDHLDHVGVHHLVRYLAAAGADYVAIRTARAAVIGQSLIDAEVRDALRVDADPVLVHATKNDFVPVIREAYRSAVKDECARLATWILNRLDGGWVTDAQMRTVFDLTTGEWTTLKSKMTTLRDNWLAVQVAAGE
jgi:hypothetical protein